MATRRIPNRKHSDHLRQVAEVKTTFPGLERSFGRDKAVTWEGDLQPTPDSPRYRLRVEYHLGGPPRVVVLSPPLRPGAPHLYDDGSLCLYWPGEWLWRTSDKSIAKTVIPWAAFWLFYYELWSVTGEWLGPSSHAPSPKSPEVKVSDNGAAEAES